MKSIKIRIGRLSVLMVTMIVLLMIGSGCAMKNTRAGGNYNVSLKTVYAADLPAKTTTECKIQVSLPEDVRNKQQAANVIGYVKNIFGMHLASILAEKNINEWVQTCIVKNLGKAGFNVITGKMTSNGLYVSTSIRTLECEAMMSYIATIILDVKLKNSNSIFFKQTFTGKAVQPNWIGSAQGYGETLTKAMKQCLDKMMPVLIKELEKAGKTIKNTVQAPKKTTQAPKTTTQQKIKVKKDSKGPLDDIYF